MALPKLAETHFPPEPQAAKGVSRGFQACITEEERRSVEKLSVDMATNRRIMLAMLGRSLDQLIAADGKMPSQQVAEAIFTMLKSVDSYGKHLDDMKGLVESAQTRLLIAAQTMVDRGLVE